MHAEASLDRHGTWHEKHASCIYAAEAQRCSDREHIIVHHARPGGGKMTTTLVSMPGGASEGEAFVTSCVPMPAATDTTSPCSTSVACAGAGEAGCGMGLAGAGRAAEASETVVASTRSGGRRSSAAQINEDQRRLMEEEHSIILTPIRRWKGKKSVEGKALFNGP